MKIFALALLLAVCCATHGDAASTNLIEICLLDRPLAHPWPKLDAANLKNLNPVSPPVLTDPDFVAFDPTNHTFVITGTAAQRLALTIWTLAKKDNSAWSRAPIIYQNGTFELIPVPAPFVFQVRGERIYAGAFYTFTSSSSFPGPVILAEELFISTNVPPNAQFSFSIRPGYPWESPATPDPRNDSRIVSAVQTLFGK